MGTKPELRQITRVHDGVYSIHGLDQLPVSGIAIYQYSHHWECELHGNVDCDHIRDVKKWIG